MTVDKIASGPVVKKAKRAIVLMPQSVLVGDVWCGVVVPLRMDASTNQRLHWRVLAKKVATQRTAVRKALAQLEGQEFHLPIVVEMTRIAPNALDDDNNVTAMKAVRDEVAVFLKLKSDRVPGVAWKCWQQKAKPRTYGLEIRIYGALP